MVLRGELYVGVSLVLAVLLAVATTAPTTTTAPDDVVYDQRQNGSENLRISLSDVRVVVAPAESLLSLTNSAVSSLAYMGLLGACGDDAKCKTATSQQRSRLRLNDLFHSRAQAQHVKRHTPLSSSSSTSTS